MGASQSISFPITVINTIVADAIEQMVGALEAKLRKKASFEQAVLEVVRETYNQHKRIVFNGDGYSAAWHKEAAKRGLLNLRTAVDAIERFTDEKNIQLFSRLGVLSEREIHARQEIMYDIYFKQVNIEGETTEWIVQTQILPGALSYLAELSEIEVKSKAVQRTIQQVVEATDALSDALEKLKVQNAELGGDEVHEKAHHMRDNVLPAMAEVRKAADALERILADKYWPLPSYREMLFVK
ncbi:hypothetical protein Mlute_01286 [Meiothermus luteus]|uniref:GS catalytic domain-containing protein n=2 Tax=Meiothermus luteus TaxID=2026184 RepID=A0A399ES13_9DEIN|nr:hypothetical protein Mlute_01286 [Meiothermus luteus]